MRNWNVIRIEVLRFVLYFGHIIMATCTVHVLKFNIVLHQRQPALRLPGSSLWTLVDSDTREFTVKRLFGSVGVLEKSLKKSLKEFLSTTGCSWEFLPKFSFGTPSGTSPRLRPNRKAFLPSLDYRIHNQRSAYDIYMNEPIKTDKVNLLMVTEVLNSFQLAPMISS